MKHDPHYPANNHHENTHTTQHNTTHNTAHNTHHSTTHTQHTHNKTQHNITRTQAQHTAQSTQQNHTMLLHTLVKHEHTACAHPLSVDLGHRRTLHRGLADKGSPPIKVPRLSQPASATGVSLLHFCGLPQGHSCPLLNRPPRNQLPRSVPAGPFYTLSPKKTFTKISSRCT